MPSSLPLPTGPRGFSVSRHAPPSSRKPTTPTRKSASTSPSAMTSSSICQVVIGERFRNVDIHEGAVKSVPFIRDRFRDGAGPRHQRLHRPCPAHSRSSTTPWTRETCRPPGFTPGLTAEISAKILGSSADYRHYEAEVKGYIPLDEGALHHRLPASYNQTLGNSVPFLEQSILGGENTLRGYGRNRFIDNSYFLLNLEERIRLFRWEIFHVNADWELAPFIDFGSVMKSLARCADKRLRIQPRRRAQGGGPPQHRRQDRCRFRQGRSGGVCGTGVSVLGLTTPNPSLSRRGILKSPLLDKEA